LKIGRWILDNLLWDVTSRTREGFWGGLWAARKLLIAIVASVFLTGWEWVEHHPPQLAVVELIHFVFVLAAIAVVVRVGQWFKASSK